MSDEVSYCTDGFGGTYFGGDSHGKHRPWLVGFWLVLDFLSHFASPGSSRAWLWYRSTLKGEEGLKGTSPL